MNKYATSQLLRIASDCHKMIVEKKVAENIFQSTMKGNQGEIHGSLSLALEATRLAPQYAPGFNHLGNIYAKFPFVEGKDAATKAIDAFRTAVRLEPKEGVWHMNLAIAHGSKNNWAESKLHLDEAKSLGFTPDKKVETMIRKKANGETTCAEARRSSAYDWSTIAATCLLEAFGW